MKPCFLVVLALVLAGPVAADDSGCFVVRLGRDTVGIERYVRTASSLTVEQVGRAPRVTRRHFAYDYAGGVLTHLAAVVTPAGAAVPTQTVDATVEPDSLRLSIRNGSGPAQVLGVAFPRGTLVVSAASPWAGYEGRIMELVGARQDSVRTTMYFLGSPAPGWLSLRRLGRDTVVILNEHQDLFHARVDRAGRILGVRPLAGTGKFSVERVAALDVDSMTTAFAGREQAGGGLGMLSPRDTLRIADAGGASLWVDYGRPAVRGRTIFGEVVPFGEVWRTGANAATQFRSDRDLDFGGTVVPAGFYTLWTIPAPGGWKLVVNAETGQWGTEHKAAKDLFTIPMKVNALAQPVERFTIGVEPNARGGVLELDWDTTRASAAFTVRR